jgi:uncharacterized protein (TIGR02597 family)
MNTVTLYNYVRQHSALLASKLSITMPQQDLKLKPLGIAFAFAILGLSCPLKAQSDSSPLGLYHLGAYDSSGNYLGLLGNSDTLVSMPFTRNPEFTGTIQSVSNNVVTVTGTPGWAGSQFVYLQGIQPKTYYALIGANTGGPANLKEGCIYTVTANGTNTVTFALNGDSITSVPANSQISLIPYWTLGTVFPATNQNVSFTATTSTRDFQTQVLLPNFAATGVNLGYSETYYFINTGANVGWRLFGDATTTDHSDDILIPSSYFVVRNNNGAPTLPLVVTGNVLTGKVTLPETTLAAQSQDNDVTMIRPLDVTLNDSGLTPTNGSFVATTSTRSFKDQLFIYNNAQVTLNKSPSATYYYMNGAWRLFGDTTTVDHGSDLISSGSALTIRKAASGTGTTDFWQNTPTY